VDRTGTSAPITRVQLLSRSSLSTTRYARPFPLDEGILIKVFLRYCVREYATGYEALERLRNLDPALGKKSQGAEDCPQHAKGRCRLVRVVWAEQYPRCVSVCD